MPFDNIGRILLFALAPGYVLFAVRASYNLRLVGLEDLRLLFNVPIDVLESPIQTRDSICLGDRGLPTSNTSPEPKTIERPLDCLYPKDA